MQTATWFGARPPAALTPFAVRSARHCRVGARTPRTAPSRTTGEGGRGDGLRCASDSPAPEIPKRCHAATGATSHPHASAADEKRCHSERSPRTDISPAQSLGGLPRNLLRLADEPAFHSHACPAAIPRRAACASAVKTGPGVGPAVAHQRRLHAEQRWAHAARRRLSRPRLGWRTTGLAAAAAGFLGGAAGIRVDAVSAHRAPLGMPASRSSEVKREAPRCSPLPNFGRGDSVACRRGSFRRPPREG
jgi:hypothetical protein